MHLLVTRPEPDAAATAVRLRGMGHGATVAPMLTIVFADPPADLPEPRLIMLTSRNGLRALARWPQAAAWHDITVIATGLATATAAREAGFRDVREAGGDSSAVAEYVRRHVGRGAGPILYPAARERAGALAGGLTAQGYDIRAVAAYRADAATAFPPDVRAQLVNGLVHGVLVYSRRTALAFCGLVGSESLEAVVRDMDVFAISAQAADPMSGFGRRIHVAAQPTEESLLALLPRPADVAAAR